ncbi:MAG TPA: translation elongation factor 4, partial [Spirochaetia bacterium]|nr:translation elongation factor 4 [Spirochaetia bacterium]
METQRIRNFCIIAHIDHGKSTLADRFIQRARLVSDRDFHDQILDTMDIERERGITIKSQAVAIPYKARDGQEYVLNLVDTPGHVDFSYEVSRSISACEGAVLLIDASQGVEAQTLANLYMALEHNLEIIPVINKIDLPSADIEGVRRQIGHDLGLDADEALLVSGKLGTGVDELCEAIVQRVPPPVGSPTDPLKALIFDSHYDVYRGVIVHVRLYSGTLQAGMTVRFWWNGSTYKVEETGIFRLALVPAPFLGPGEVGYLIAGIKTVSDTRVGDTVTDDARPCSEPLAGFRDVKPVVFSSIYPVDANDYEELVQAMAKLKLNDASLIYEKDSSVALGYGFRCGFLGLLHLEIVQERLEREFQMSIVFTAPSVQYRVTLQGGKVEIVDNPANFPDPSQIVAAEEPYISASMITPSQYLGNIITLCLEKRGTQKSMSYLDEKRVELVFEMPLAEVVFDFY